jgi:hypothetical protein
MYLEQEREYHLQRARTELDWAYRAEGRNIAELHLRLSALHMARLKTLGAGASTPRLNTPRP